ncbi:MAG: hypothetical protein JNL73_21660 [Anaerolineales bacterium]|nr:hypothetical protein [Anaerolineales bacterium]
MGNAELMCANCDQVLDPGDLYCRTCGLPTVRAYALRAQTVGSAPDLQELERALDIAPEPEVMERVTASTTEHGDTEPLERSSFLAQPAPRLRLALSPLSTVLLIALVGAIVVFFLLLTLG